MRYVKRPNLPKKSQNYLSKKQNDVTNKKNQPGFSIDAIWKHSRKSKSLKAVFTMLQEMMGSRERCMYCLDSHGSDIEHFRPKAIFLGHVFEWSNLLLCCTECGRLKGSRFPLAADNSPLLIDPTNEDPWDHIDFDPTTCCMTARFDLRTNDWSEKGLRTVEVLNLDKREALEAGHRITLARLSAVVTRYLDQTINEQDLLAELRREDDYGLLGWCFGVTGQTFSPFSELKKLHPAVWDYCCQSTNHPA